MKILQINVTVNAGSTGRIAEEIGRLVLSKGHESFIAFGRGKHSSASQTIRIGNLWDICRHGLKSRILDRHGFGSGRATKNFIEKVKILNPDLIHLHNIHGYYINVEILFNFLKQSKKPIIWTLHDCWPFTGHCGHFEYANCFKWETQCFECPNKNIYPTSWGLDKSRENYFRKKDLFTDLPNMTIVVPSKWLREYLKRSFLKSYPVHTIYNGINLDVYRPTTHVEILERYDLKGSPFILGIAHSWSRIKGLNDLIKLRGLLPSDISIVLVGLTKEQVKRLPNGIIGITHTENISDLVSLYTEARVFVNPVYVDNFPTTNIESLACGTPVVTYDTGGSPEALDQKTGIVVEKGNIIKLSKAILEVLQYPKKKYQESCRQRALLLFDAKNRYEDYLNLYMNALKK